MTLEDWPDIDELEKNQNALNKSLIDGESVGIDGVVSKKTARLTREFRTIGFDMTRWWAVTPPIWNYPVCEKLKPPHYVGWSGRRPSPAAP